MVGKSNAKHNFQSSRQCMMAALALGCFLFPIASVFFSVVGLIGRSLFSSEQAVADVARRRIGNARSLRARRCIPLGATRSHFGLPTARPRALCTVWVHLPISICHSLSVCTSRDFFNNASGGAALHLPWAHFRPRPWHRSCETGRACLGLSDDAGTQKPASSNFSLQA